MRMVKFLPIFLIGCAYGVEDKIPAEPEKKAVWQPSTPTHEKPARRKCYPYKSVPVKGCELYYLTCDDGEEDMALVCHTEPMVPIDDYPDPI